jgi:hypothetical protein
MSGSILNVNQQVCSVLVLVSYITFCNVQLLIQVLLFLLLTDDFTIKFIIKDEFVLIK